MANENVGVNVTTHPKKGIETFLGYFGGAQKEEVKNIPALNSLGWQVGSQVRTAVMEIE